jgi:predicted transposase/invertase (TIGR01784 family)
MREPEYCKKLLEIILGFPIRRIEYLQEEKALSPNVQSKGIRLDIYAEDDCDTVYNVEMQTRKQEDLGKRSRYYQAIIDLNLIDKGAAYDQLRNNLVIFICKFDLFGENRYIYTFENRCVENLQQRLGDGTKKIFVNTKGKHGSPNEEFVSLMKFFNGEDATDEYTRGLESAVCAAKSNEKWRTEYMHISMLEYQARKEGREEGREEGKTAEREESIRNLTEVCKSLGCGLEDTKRIVLEKYETDEKLIESFWNQLQ